jgi:hypothetical protein
MGEAGIKTNVDLAAQKALRDIGFASISSSSLQQARQSYGHTNSSSSGESSVPFPTQTAPTHELYQKARQAAISKAQPEAAKRPSLPSQRRPWKEEEEKCLMAGLDAVRGPHWSQILALHGANGTVNNILKDRNQVQLKDKARNLKLFFLKGSVEVPYYLQSVTGELKTRAPSQAARKEAEDRARANNTEEQAKVDGNVTFPSGLRDSQTAKNHSMPEISQNVEQEKGNSSVRRTTSI